MASFILENVRQQAASVLYKCRRLRKSARMVCATEEAAAQAVQLLRDAALPKRKSVQRRLLVILNPCSGRGRSASCNLH